MKSVHLSNDSVMTGDELADGLLEFALALSREQRVEVVELPVVDHEGAVQRARFLVGGSIPLWTMTVDPNGTPELKDPDARDELRRRTDQLELEWLLPQG